MGSKKKRKNCITLFLVLLFFGISVFIAVKSIHILYPLKHVALIERYAVKYQLSPVLVHSVINAESRYREQAKSAKGASGLMQLMEVTADWGAEEIALPDYHYGRIFEPAINIELGCWYLGKLLQQYNGNEKVALAAYNAGSGNVAKWLADKDYSSDGVTLKQIPFRETREYIEKIERYKKVYEILLMLQSKPWSGHIFFS